MSFSHPFQPDTSKLTLFRMKLLSWLLLGFCTLLLLFYCFTAYENFRDGAIILDVHSAGKGGKYIDEMVNGHDYVSGIYGKLHFKGQNFTDILLLMDIGSNNLVDILFFLAIALILFFTIRRIDDQKAFSRPLINTLFYVALLFLLLPMIKGLYQLYVLDPLLLQRTGGAFELAHVSTMDTGRVIFMYVILMVLYFLKKGYDLQQDQEYTV